MRKKLIKCLFVALGFCLLQTLSAFAAEDLPILPVMPEGNYEITLRKRFRSSTGEQAIKTLVPAVLGETARWEADGGENYLFNLYELESEDSFNINLSAVYTQMDFSDNSVFEYIIREPGSYYLFCDMQDSSGNVGSTYISFYVEAEEGIETVSSRVTEIVSECRSAVTGEYETALWLHDWVTAHSYYDTNYNYHGADSILFYGTGVCDSYSKLYLRLLQEAGIEAHRIDSPEMAHAWNIVKIDDVWCQIDPTWDDPVVGSNDTSLVSGHEDHMYFGMNDKLMQLDHEYTPDTECSSLQNCYVKREGLQRVWLSHMWEDIENHLKEGNISFGVNSHGIVLAEEGGFYDDVDYVTRIMTIATIIMSDEKWNFRGGRSVSADFSYDADEELLRCEVVPSDMNFYLPGRLKVIGKTAFEGAESIEAIYISDGVEQICEGAFADCTSLMWVIIMSDEVIIDKDAFEGVPDGFVLVCHKNSAGDQFAKEHNIKTKYLD